MNQGYATARSEATGPSLCAGNTPREDRNFPGRLSPPAGCKCISKLQPPRIGGDSELDPGKILNPGPPSPSLRDGIPSLSYRLRAADGFPVEPGRRRCAQLEDSAVKEARSALAAGGRRSLDCGVPAARVAPGASSPGTGRLVLLLRSGLDWWGYMLSALVHGSLGGTPCPLSSLSYRSKLQRLRKQAILVS